MAEQDFSSGVAFVRGQYVPVAQAGIAITDWGFLRSDAMLEGVTRRTVIEMAQSLGLETQLRALPADELCGAEEVFISTSGGGVLPVTRIDNRAIAVGQVGPVTRQLVQSYWAWHTDPA